MRARFGMATFVVFACLGSVAACVESDGIDDSDPTARLEFLGGAWLRRSATVNYSTVVHPAGSARSIHQCLRQMAGGEIGRQTAIRMCSGAGELTLTWDPPDSWRMDVSNAQGSSVLVSTPDGAYHCHRSDGDRRRCAQTSAGELESSAQFGAIFLRPTRILDELGPGAADSLTTRPDREIAGIGAECFSATLPGRNGDSRRADWCFSKDGVLLMSRVELAEVGTSILEAIAVRRGVSDAAFEVVPPKPIAETGA